MKEQILKKHMDKAGINFNSTKQTYNSIIAAMEEYHQSQLKNIGDIASVSNQRELLIAFFDKANEDDLQECINGFTGRVYDRLKGNL